MQFKIFFFCLYCTIWLLNPREFFRQNKLMRKFKIPSVGVPISFKVAQVGKVVVLHLFPNADLMQFQVLVQCTFIRHRRFQKIKHCLHEYIGIYNSNN